MEFGAHLPLLSFRGESRDLADLIRFTRTARDAGFRFLCANDHLVFSRPWLDGPTALASVIAESGDMTLATTVSLPIVRGPAPLAKTLAALDVLSGGRVVAGIGPGSSARDHQLVGLDFDERWTRLDQCVATLRALLRGNDYTGKHYATHAERLEPVPVQPDGPPIWLGSWGGPSGLHRTALAADGWLASGYNTDPVRFAQSLAKVREHVAAVGRDPDAFPNAIATMWTFVSDDAGEARKMLEEVLAPMLRRPLEQLEAVLPIGSPEQCAERLRRYREAGAQRVFIWPLGDEIAQLERFATSVVPLVSCS